jgi:WD40 repeat protein
LIKQEKYLASCSSDTTIKLWNVERFTAPAGAIVGHSDSDDDNDKKIDDDEPSLNIDAPLITLYGHADYVQVLLLLCVCVLVCVGFE